MVCGCFRLMAPIPPFSLILCLILNNTVLSLVISSLQIHSRLTSRVCVCVCVNNAVVYPERHALFIFEKLILDNLRSEDAVHGLISCKRGLFFIWKACVSHSYFRTSEGVNHCLK